MPSRQLTLTNKRGLHARAATRLVQCCQPYQSSVTVRHGTLCGDASNIMSLLMLAAPCGTELTIEAEGDDAEAVLDALEALFDARFDEDA
ncbi:HPr family phosphocarrier protein [Halomonas huangheensis]|uniref:Phosphate ABC transporter permease n=1 Tax=Halomonas huangheensis TaxID=1178482 RepID=W1N569_9GAMM|nr:HPr family phosphocarrier protein [Halomonas huangheensis]ALM52106.1 phosphate ABC transporter permease [Halomonas huangheensis]ERL50668.1 phosphate ABC transporter permease [Halomonas huangheensis]